jgi:hypothetical protein
LKSNKNWYCSGWILLKFIQSLFQQQINDALNGQTSGMSQPLDAIQIVFAQEFKHGRTSLHQETNASRFQGHLDVRVHFA